ncbi:MAG: hypothetical protein IJJ60_08520, partial [Clostridia bacterium]|nr:hypothetical protein [Clostridia bacterium]
EGDNNSVTDWDQGNVAAKDFDKEGRSIGFVTLSNGDSVLAFEYSLNLYGVSDDDFDASNNLTVTDNYSQHAQYVEFYNITTDAYNNPTNALSGMDGTWAQIIQNGYRSIGQNAQKIVPSDSNGVLTFTLNKSAFPKDGEGNYLPRYQIVYYMIVKNATAQANLEAAAEANLADRKVYFTNTAAWGSLNDTVTLDYSKPVVTKEHIAPSGGVQSGSDLYYDPATSATGFRITIQHPGHYLNNGTALTLKDVFTDNLSVDYSSIHITINGTDDTSHSISYDYRGNTGTFTIPDYNDNVARTIVISYDAKVLGAPGQWQHYGNTATMNGYQAGVSGDSYIAGSAEGGFNINSIKIYKYEAGDMTKPIPNVEFTLVSENGDPVVYTVSSSAAGHEHQAGDLVTYTTDENGYAEIKPSEQEDGFSIQKGITYYVKETGTPINYAVNNTIYRFTLSDNPNYANYEYHSGDIMKIYNWPVTGKLDIRKTITGGPENLTDEDKRRITFTVAGYYDAEKTKPVKVDDWGYPVDENAANAAAAAGKTLRNYSLSISYADFTLRGTSGNTYYNYLLEDLVPGYYVVTETNAALPGYSAPTTTITEYSIDRRTGALGSSMVYNNSTSVDAYVDDTHWHQIDISNNYGTSTGTQVTIKKINNETSVTLPLYGAKFKLEKKNGDNWEIFTGSSTDENGVFTITYYSRETGVRLAGLTDGEYRITEIQAPTNYKVTGNGVFGFTVSGNTVTYDSGVGTAEVTYDSTNKLFTVDNDVKHNYTLTKVDGANVSLKLEGAVFGVFEHVPGNTPAQDRTLATQWDWETMLLGTYTSDANGQFEILANDPLNGGAHYDTNSYKSYSASTGWVMPAEGESVEAGTDRGSRTYFIMEITAPEGYSLPNPRPLYYYYFGEIMPLDVSTTGAANLATSRRSATVTNDLIELTV